MQSRKVFVIYLLACVLVLIACQQNPDKNVVSSKNDDSFDVEIAISNNENHTPDVSLDVEFEAEFRSTDESVLFVMDLNETITAANMPVLEVVPHQLTAEDAMRVASALFGNSELWEARPFLAPELTKQEIQERIIRWSEYTTIEALTELYGSNKSSEDLALVRKFIQDYTERYEIASEERMCTPCRWEFRKMSYYYFSYDQANALDTSKDNDAIVAELVTNGYPYRFSVQTRNQNDFNFNEISVSFDAGIGPDFIDNRIFRAELCRTEKPTAGQLDSIRSVAESMLSQMELGKWAIKQCYVNTVWFGDVPEYSISIIAVPSLEGVSAVYQQQLSSWGSTDSYASNYKLTEAIFEFSPNGTLMSFKLNSPIDIENVINDNVTVMSPEQLFEKAQMVFSLSDYYQYGFGGAIKDVAEPLSCTVYIKEMEYNLARIKVPNNDDAYYYVPAMLFRGTVEYYGSVSKKTYYEITTPTELLVLNAIDGSMINNTNQ